MLFAEKKIAEGDIAEAMWKFTVRFHVASAMSAFDDIFSAKSITFRKFTSYRYWKESENEDDGVGDSEIDGV